MRINEDYMEVIDRDDIANDSALSMDVRQNVQWLLDGLDTNIDFGTINEPIYRPKDGKELRSLIRICVKKYGNKCSLNWIDVSGIKNMENMFFKSEFNGNLSKWDVSRVRNMSFMFQNSCFNGDISKWDTSMVLEMVGMFQDS